MCDFLVHLYDSIIYLSLIPYFLLLNDFHNNCHLFNLFPDLYSYIYHLMITFYSLFPLNVFLHYLQIYLDPLFLHNIPSIIILIQCFSNSYSYIYHLLTTFSIPYQWSYLLILYGSWQVHLFLPRLKKPNCCML